MYSSAFRAGEFGYGLAAAAVLVMECLAAILVINFIFRSEKGVGDLK
jgi:raffinose/stachyose/melibiose transport system permease protein